MHEYLIFNAARGVGRELDVLVAAVRVHCLDEPDRTDGDEVFDVDAGIFKPARDVGDKPQVVLNERAAHALVAFVHARDELSFLLPLERRRERIAAADVEDPRMRQQSVPCKPRAKPIPKPPEPTHVPPPVPPCAIRPESRCRRKCPAKRRPAAVPSPCRSRERCRSKTPAASRCRPPSCRC